MPKLYRNDYDFTLIIGSYAVRPGDTIELIGYNGSMLTPVQADEPALEPEVEEKSKRARKATTEPEAE